jgi:DNA-binding response OmpR family regulator
VLVARILLADDDEGNRITLAALLEDEGHHVDLAGSFAEASQALASRGYDVALLDQYLGDGLGSDLLPLAQARSARVVFLSGSTELEGLGPVFLKGRPFRELLSLLGACIDDDSTR